MASGDEGLVSVGKHVRLWIHTLDTVEGTFVDKERVRREIRVVLLMLVYREVSLW